LLKHLKAAVLAILRPITAALIRSGIHPNALTFAGFAVSACAAWQYAAGSLAWAAALVLAAGVFDLLDGAVAREGARASRWGAFLDSNVDRYAEIVVFVGILWRFQGDAVAQLGAAIAICGSLMVSYTKARAEGLGEEVGGGLLQRPERVVLLALGSFFGEAGLRAVIWILAVFTNLTSVQRMILVARSMKKREAVRAGVPVERSEGGEAAGVSRREGTTG
jgi:CDP-diacylglycerol--glycerol-3-phosphate 3-phosphatidyltransferase